MPHKNKKNSLSISKKLKKTKQKKRRYRKTRKMIKGGTIIGQGTHGIIKIDETNTNMVVKQFNNLSFCKELINEYEVQKSLHNELLKTHINIYIPDCCCYIGGNDTCSYMMERIFPLPDKTFYLIINLAMPDINTKFSHSKLGYEVGYNILQNTYNIDISNLSYELGKLYSYLHYVLKIDGYDCELLYGNIKNENKFILIDFDKVQYFDFNLEFVSYRKLDEQTIDKKPLNTYNRFAWFLFVSLISMSLLPTLPLYKTKFIEGYSTYVNNNNLIMKQIFDLVVENINYYEV
jgi:hypothetical protein